MWFLCGRSQPNLGTMDPDQHQEHKKENSLFHLQRHFILPVILNFVIHTIGHRTMCEILCLQNSKQLHSVVEKINLTNKMEAALFSYLCLGHDQGQTQLFSLRNPIRPKFSPDKAQMNQRSLPNQLTLQTKKASIRKFQHSNKVRNPNLPSSISLMSPSPQQWTSPVLLPGTGTRTCLTSPSKSDSQDFLLYSPQPLYKSLLSHCSESLILVKQAPNPCCNKHRSPQCCALYFQIFHNKTKKKVNILEPEN